MNITKIPSLSLVIPCYNEEQVFPASLQALETILTDLKQQGKITQDSYILFVDDGSRDKTWALIEQAAKTSAPPSAIRGLKLSRNCGHQIALLAGLSHVDTDICISIDADLQDDTNCIYQMLDSYNQGHDIVYGVRGDRSSDSAFKRATANGFYKFMSLMGVTQVENHADYRLLSRRALAALLRYKEENIYLRGMIPLLGFSSAKVYYSRRERAAGISKYPLRKMLALAMEGITSFSVMPLRIIAFTGFITCLIALIASFYTLIEKLYGNTITGWASVMIAIFFLGGVQLLSLGVIGEYIGKIYIETKRRPKFFIEASIAGEKSSDTL